MEERVPIHEDSDNEFQVKGSVQARIGKPDHEREGVLVSLEK